MARERVDLIFTTSGTRRVRRNVTDVGDAARSSATAVTFLNRTLGTLGIGLTAAEFVRFSDTATRLNNQLRTVTTSSGNLDKVLGELFKTARETRSSIEPTVELYSRLQRSTDVLGLSQKEIIGLTKGVSQAFKIFGNTTAEAEAAVVQFSQGLASGVLRGDELRSVLEQSPRLAVAIADGLNEIGKADLSKAFGQGFQLDDGTFNYELVIGSLRELGKEGELTAENVVRAIQTQLGALEEEFLKTSPTIEDAFVQLSNKITQFFTGASAQELSANIAQGILVVVDHFDLVIGAAGVAASALAVIFVGQGIKAAIAGVKALTVAIAANPIGAIAVAITAAISALLIFGDRFQGITDSTATLKDETIAFFKTVFDFAVPIISGIMDLWESALVFIGGLFGGMGDDWKEVLTNMGGFIQEAIAIYIGFWNGFFQTVRNVWNNFPDIIKDVAISAANFLIEKFEDAVNSIIDLLNKLSSFAIGVVNGISNSFEGALNKIVDGLNFVGGGLEKLTGKDFTLDGIEIPDIDTDSLAIDPATVDRLQNDAAGAARGVVDAFAQGFEDGKDTVNGFFSDFGTGFNDNLAETVSNRLEKEAAAAANAGELETLRSDRGRAVGKVGDGGGGDEASKAALKRAAALAKVNGQLDSEIRLFNQLGPAREIQAEFDRIENSLLGKKITLTEEERKGLLEKITLVESEKGIQEAMNDVYRDTVGKVREYEDSLEALNRLLQQGVISQEQFNVAVGGLSINEELRELDKGLTGTDFASDAQIKELRLQQDEYLNVVQQALEQRIISEEEAGLRIEEIRRNTAARIEEAERARLTTQLSLAQSTFDSLSQIAEDFAGQQNGVYKALFAVSKGFAIAQGAIALYQNIAEASKIGFPQNLPLIAAAAAQGAAIISNVRSVALKFADGGLVRGPGTGTSDSINARLSDGEFVVRAVQTRKFLPLLRDINEGRVPSPSSLPPGFAEGGLFDAANTNSLGGQETIVNNVVETRREMVQSAANTNNRDDGGRGRPINMTVVTPDAESFRRSEGQIATRLSQATSRGRRNM